MATKTTDSAGGGQQAGGGADTGGARQGASAQKGASTQKGASSKSAGGQQGAGAGQKSTGANTGSGGQKSTGAKSGAAGQKSAAKSGGAKSGGAKSGGAGGGGRSKSAGGSGQPDLRSDVRSFASGRPHGWNHDDWLGFLEDLRGRGHNIEDREAIGSMLERERLTLALEQVPGIGPQRVRSIADRYGNIWRLKDVGADELAREVNIPRPLAERIVESIQ